MRLFLGLPHAAKAVAEGEGYLDLRRLRRALPTVGVQYHDVHRHLPGRLNQALEGLMMGERSAQAVQACQRRGTNMPAGQQVTVAYPLRLDAGGWNAPHPTEHVVEARALSVEQRRLRISQGLRRARIGRADEGRRGVMADGLSLLLTLEAGRQQLPVGVVVRVALCTLCVSHRHRQAKAVVVLRLGRAAVRQLHFDDVQPIAVVLGLREPMAQARLMPTRPIEHFGLAVAGVTLAEGPQGDGLVLPGVR